MSPLARLAIAGIIGPIWFVTLVVAQGVLQPDYSHVAMPISALAAWPSGWLQNLNFFVFGISTAAFAVGMHHAVRPHSGGRLATVLLLVSSAGLLIVGLYPWTMVDGVPGEPAGHVVGAVLTFAGAGLGLIALSRRMARDSNWQSLSRYVLVTGIVMLSLFVVLGIYAIEQGAPFHPWVGLLQRILVGVWLTCTMVVGWRALRIAREAVGASSS